MRCFILILFFIVGCSNLHLKKEFKQSRPIRLGVLGFKITAPVKKLKQIQTVDKKIAQLPLDEEIRKREAEAKRFFIQYMNSYYQEIETVDIPIDKVNWKEDLTLSHGDLRKMKEEYHLDALIAGEVPWYGKTNIIWPIIGFTTDITVETLIIGYVTHWNGPIILANLGWEVLTNGPLWFGGAWLFGQAYKPVTVNVKMINLQSEKIEEHEKDFEVTKSAHMLNKLPKEDRKKVENQLDASFKKALKEIAIELNE